VTKIVLRFHLDENVQASIAEGLRRRGIDVTTAADAGLSAASDEAHLAFALQSGCVLVTHDADFLKLAAQGAPHAGIAYCAHGHRSVGEILQALILLRDCCTPEEVRARVHYL
jgi:hypothetical protein